MGLHFIFEGFIMTPEQLLALIQSDSQALAMATAGNDAGCALRCRAIAEKVHAPLMLTERGLYQKLGATLAETILQKLIAFAGLKQPQSPVIARVLKWLEPVNEGVDFGDSQTIGLIQSLTAGGLFTIEEQNALIAMSLVEQDITAADVSEAMKGLRNA